MKPGLKMRDARHTVGRTGDTACVPADNRTLPGGDKMNAELKSYMLKSYIGTIRKNLAQNYKGMFREAGGVLNFPFLTPGSDQYADVLWD